MIDDISYAATTEIDRHQQLLLQRHITYLSQHSPFYRQMFADLLITAADIRGYDDLVALPTTGKADLEDNEGQFLCVDEHGIADLCLTSGTTGKPVSFYQSGSDLERLASNEEIAMRTAGICATDRVLIAAAIDRCFMAGMAYFLGLNKIGATTIRAGSSSLAVVAQMVKQLRPTAMVGVPTFFLALAQRLQQEGVNIAACGVKRLLCIGEPVRSNELSLSALGKKLQQLWGAQIYATYASTEMATTFCDCEFGQGGHLPPQLMLVEILDENGHRIDDETPGEVVATPLLVTAMPLLRFRTGDIASLYRKPCSCGRNSWRLGPVVGRKHQMFKCRGTTVYPPAIFNVLQQLDGVDGYYLEVYDQFELSDRIRVVVSCNNSELTAATISSRIAAITRVTPEVVIVPGSAVRLKTTDNNKRKPVIFFDYRR